VQAQTETVWAQANSHNVARIIFCNKMDREGADYPSCIKSVKTRLKGWGAPVMIQWPVSGLGKGTGGSTFSGVVDLVEMKRYKSSV
jgi:elongation factor G